MQIGIKKWMFYVMAGMLVFAFFLSARIWLLGQGKQLRINVNAGLNMAIRSYPYGLGIKFIFSPPSANQHEEDIRIGLGFGLDYLPSNRGLPTEYAAVVPLWIPGVLCLIVAQWLRHKYILLFKNPLGICPVCNYDLRAHRPNDKCPECGTEITLGNEIPKNKGY